MTLSDILLMKQRAFTFAFCAFILTSCKNQSMDKQKPNSTQKEEIIRTYFSGWEKKNWNLIENQLGNGFTFTSPNDDDHLPVQKFKDKCWGQADHIQKFEFIRFAGTESGCYVTYKLLTKENASFRNTEYFTFNNGKIESIEVFFGAGEGAEGFPTNKK